MKSSGGGPHRHIDHRLRTFATYNKKVAATINRLLPTRKTREPSPIWFSSLDQQPEATASNDKLSVVVASSDDDRPFDIDATDEDSDMRTPPLASSEDDVVSSAYNFAYFRLAGSRTTISSTIDNNIVAGRDDLDAAQIDIERQIAELMELREQLSIASGNDKTPLVRLPQHGHWHRDWISGAFEQNYLAAKQIETEKLLEFAARYEREREEERQRREELALIDRRLKIAECSDRLRRASELIEIEQLRARQNELESKMAAIRCGLRGGSSSLIDVLDRVLREQEREARVADAIEREQIQKEIVKKLSDVGSQEQSVVAQIANLKELQSSPVHEPIQPSEREMITPEPLTPTELRQMQIEWEQMKMKLQTIYDEQYRPTELHFTNESTDRSAKNYLQDKPIAVSHQMNDQLDSNQPFDIINTDIDSDGDKSAADIVCVTSDHQLLSISDEWENAFEFDEIQTLTDSVISDGSSTVVVTEDEMTPYFCVIAEQRDARNVATAISIEQHHQQPTMSIIIEEDDDENVTDSDGTIMVSNNDRNDSTDAVLELNCATVADRTTVTICDDVKAIVYRKLGIPFRKRNIIDRQKNENELKQDGMKVNGHVPVSNERNSESHTKASFLSAKKTKTIGRIWPPPSNTNTVASSATTNVTSIKEKGSSSSFEQPRMSLSSDDRSWISSDRNRQIDGKKRANSLIPTKQGGGQLMKPIRRSYGDHSWPPIKNATTNSTESTSTTSSTIDDTGGYVKTALKDRIQWPPTPMQTIPSHPQLKYLSSIGRCRLDSDSDKLACFSWPPNGSHIKLKNNFPNLATTTTNGIRTSATMDGFMPNVPEDSAVHIDNNMT